MVESVVQVIRANGVDTKHLHESGIAKAVVPVGERVELAGLETRFTARLVAAVAKQVSDGKTVGRLDGTDSTPRISKRPPVLESTKF